MLKAFTVAQPNPAPVIALKKEQWPSKMKSRQREQIFRPAPDFGGQRQFFLTISGECRICESLTEKSPPFHLVAIALKFAVN